MRFGKVFLPGGSQYIGGWSQTDRESINQVAGEPFTNEFARYPADLMRMLDFRSFYAPISKILAVLVQISLLAETAVAAAPVEISVHSASDLAITSGQALGSTATYVLAVTSPNVVTFAIEADNNGCGVDFIKASRRGILRSIRRFPAIYSDNSETGDVYTLSFYQTRVAALSDKACNSLFRVN